MFKGETTHLRGTLPLDLPHGDLVEAQIKIDQTGKIALEFDQAAFANEIMVSALQGQLMGMSLNYQYAVPVERRGGNDASNTSSEGGSTAP